MCFITPTTGEGGGRGPERINSSLNGAITASLCRFHTSWFLATGWMPKGRRVRPVFFSSSNDRHLSAIEDAKVNTSISLTAIPPRWDRGGWVEAWEINCLAKCTAWTGRVGSQNFPICINQKNSAGSSRVKFKTKSMRRLRSWCVDFLSKSSAEMVPVPL